MDTESSKLFVVFKGIEIFKLNVLAISKVLASPIIGVKHDHIYLKW